MDQLLSWHIQMKIALDTARGLEYLHEQLQPPTIHRDLKSSNILLDSDFNAKISDFGLAVSSGNRSKGNLKLSGTLGYVAPEYLLDGKLTEKSLCICIRSSTSLSFCWEGGQLRRWPHLNANQLLHGPCLS
ncbi:hypothetical protein QYE76_007557 [Lolium multiflorum]|uniref:non-specific serine/threonine protein kinase n=1 Tax=Lolium multiflorum TaxID=4521 RepID=A0AAD8QJA7_LOLMU|nr:hypothetical protein QYE76_007557 [Lolium multiflorum]